LAKAYAALPSAKADVFWSAMANARTGRRRMGVSGPMARRSRAKSWVALGRGPTWCWSARIFHPARHQSGYICIWRRGKCVLNHPFSIRIRYCGAMNRGMPYRRGICAPRCAATPIQLRRALRGARAVFAGELSMQNLDGPATCLPDMLPVIGKAPGMPG